MTLTYRQVDYNLDTDCNLLAKWTNDKDIKHLIGYFPDKESFNIQSSADDFKKRATRAPINRPNSHLMILREEIPIGCMDFEIDAPHLESGKEICAWISIIIGEHMHRGKGYGLIAMKHLEQLAKVAGAKWIEIGVFEMNERAVSLYKKLNYQEFKRIPRFTYYNDKMWDDIRMIKKL